MSEVSPAQHRAWYGFLGHPSGHHWRGLFSHHVKPDVPNEKNNVADVPFHVWSQSYFRCNTYLTYGPMVGYIPVHPHVSWLLAPHGSPPFLQVILSSSFCWGVAPKWHRRKSSTCRGLRYGCLSWFIPQKNAGIVGRWCDIVWYNFTKMGIQWRLGVLFGVTIVGYTAWTCMDGALYLIHRNFSIWICQ